MSERIRSQVATDRQLLRVLAAVWWVVPPPSGFDNTELHEVASGNLGAAPVRAVPP